MLSRPLLVTAAHDESIRYWDITEEHQLETIIVKDSQINALSISPNGQNILAGGYQNVKLFDTYHNPNQAHQTYAVHEKNVTSLGFTADAVCIFTGSDDGTARIWDRRSPKLSCVCAFKLNVAINSVVMHPNQREFLVADVAGGVYIWDIRKNKSDSLIMELNSNEFVTSVDVDAAGRQIAAITNRGNVSLYNCTNDLILGSDEVPHAAPLLRFRAHAAYGLRCRFSPDGKYLVSTAGDDLPRLWDISKVTPTDPHNFIQKRTFEGEKLTVRGFDGDTRKSRKEYEDLAGAWTWDAAFTNDSARLVVPGADRVIRLFDIESGNEVRHCIGHNKGITAMAFWDHASRQR